MGIDNSAAAGIIVKNGQWIADNATSLFRTQWASAASAAQNSAEQAEYSKIAEQMKYVFTQDGASVKLQQTDEINSPFLQIIEEGMDAPLSGGDGGTATAPDGSTYRSSVPSQLWGTELPQYAKEPNPVSDGIQTMLESLVPGWVNDVAVDSSDEIAELVKSDVVNLIQNSLGGDS